MALRYCDTDDENEYAKQQPSIYDICYRSPAKDVAPPPGVRVLDLDQITIALSLRRKVPATKRAKKRRKTRDFEIFEDSDEDEMLFASQGEERVSEDDAVLAMVDAAVRMNISGDLGRAGSMIEGLTARFLDTPTSLASLAPAVFSESALKVGDVIYLYDRLGG